MATNQDVIALHKANPTLSSGQIARILNAHPAWVVATFHRKGLKLPNSGRVAPVRITEREKCAKIAEAMGAIEVAAAIRRVSNGRMAS